MVCVGHGVLLVVAAGRSLAAAHPAFDPAKVELGFAQNENGKLKIFKYFRIDSYEEWPY